MNPLIIECDGQLIYTASILNQRGLHARAAAKFVKTAGNFDAEITVSRLGQTVSGNSILGLMMLAASAGSKIKICCWFECLLYVVHICCSFDCYQQNM